MIGPGLLRGLLPPGAVGFDSRGDTSPARGVRADEAGLVGSSVASSASRMQSIDARDCAREALLRLGLPPVGIPRRPDGAPEWPPGIVGALTHTAGYRGAVLGRSADFAGLGVDAEPLERLPSGLVRTFAGEAERARLIALRGHAAPHALELALFTAKEAAFKAWCPASGRWIGMLGVELFLDIDTFFVQPERGHCVRGRWAVRDGYVLAVAWLTMRCPILSGPPRNW
ncbi:4'-phosphopantetheinyl transferase [Rathayibacter rathayi]|uniref:4'-phosphopantetheinyl transferase n=2 Tax=Rathayibacter rathayi TaxID=33887 RepID=A0ABX5A9C5_RATRA|nr:4'-phosphopantetheinyl transferase [Rathayibacter rathayi]SOE05810.1 4'-phosphopantetheinyl transferase EntD (siderophore biosynthesis) [Rathayibacter rathayi NCPPB 2980 = VKM Ac-1601]PPF45718.1 4'-phosphopantetheinyl transferase [Rathayibacter rathayi]PPF78299.1 4'-phosphopantetheinyl transferase [Rathayibacter rathayi]PPG11679.1 4'-phosphopantetheinyl transferase [Rathayibacter rathayi]